MSTIQTYHHLAIPLVNAQIGIEELLKKDTGGLVTTNPQTGEILLAYESSAMSIDASSIVNLPNQIFSSSVSPDPVPLIPIGTSIDTTITFNKYLNFPNNEELTAIYFSSGDLKWTVTNNLRHEVEVTLNIPSLVSNSASFIFYNDSTSVNPISSNQKGTTNNLQSYTFDLTQGNLGYNEMIIEFIVKINGSGSSIATGGIL